MVSGALQVSTSIVLGPAAVQAHKNPRSVPDVTEPHPDMRTQQPPLRPLADVATLTR